MDHPSVPKKTWLELMEVQVHIHMIVVSISDALLSSALCQTLFVIWARLWCWQDHPTKTQTYVFNAQLPWFHDVPWMKENTKQTPGSDQNNHSSNTMILWYMVKTPLQLQRFCKRWYILDVFCTYMNMWVQWVQYLGVEISQHPPRRVHQKKSK